MWLRKWTPAVWTVGLVTFVHSCLPFRQLRILRCPLDEVFLPFLVFITSYFVVS